MRGGVRVDVAGFIPPAHWRLGLTEMTAPRTLELGWIGICDDVAMGNARRRTAEQLSSADHVLAQIVERLVAVVDPERLILFGSRARGQAGPRSDYDILIVKSEPDPAKRRTGRLYQALWGIPAPIDLLWFTPDEVEAWSGVPQHVATQATRQGLVVYEKRTV